MKKRRADPLSEVFLSEGLLLGAFKSAHDVAGGFIGLRPVQFGPAFTRERRDGKG